MIHLMRIEIDGHFHGSPDVPKPWVARITGPDSVYGLARAFVDPLRDWKKAKRAWSGNVHCVVAHFPIRDGELYECSRLRGKPSKRRVVREFFAVVTGKREPLTVAEALAVVDGHDDRPSWIHKTPDDQRASIAEVRGIGTPLALPFVVRDGDRQWLLRVGAVYEVAARRFAGCDDLGSLVTLTEQEAASWLARAK